jgi:hypothetical protein
MSYVRWIFKSQFYMKTNSGLETYVFQKHEITCCARIHASLLCSQDTIVGFEVLTAVLIKSIIF